MANCIMNIYYVKNNKISYLNSNKKIILKTKLINKLMKHLSFRNKLMKHLSLNQEGKKNPSCNIPTQLYS